MRRMQQTSLETYFKIVADGTLNKRQMQVYDALMQHGPSTDRELSDYTSLPINQITPRRGELVADGYVVKRGETLQENGHRATLWGIKQVI